MSQVFLYLTTSAVVGVLAAHLDLRRRNLHGRPLSKGQGLVYLDVASTAGAAAFSGGALVRLAMELPAPRTATMIAAALGIGVFTFLWSEGRRANQFQRPAGLVLGEALALASIVTVLLRAAAGSRPLITAWDGAIAIAGGLTIAWVLRAFLNKREEHRIIERLNVESQGERPEYAPATPECPNPERWKMLDSMSAEIEVLDALRQFVITLKPRLVVETGTFIAASTIAIAEGLRQNGFGKVITCEFDREIFEKAKQRIDASEVSGWIDCRNASSLEMQVDGAIDMFFSDSRLAIREQEIRRFLPQISANGIILMHDTNSHTREAREVAFRLEQEGLISMVLLPTPRGLMIGQKRDGRK